MAFLAGQSLTASLLNDATTTIESATDAVAGTTTSATYTDTLTSTGTHTLNFVAPASGKIVVTIACVAVNGTAGAYAAMSFRVSGAAGTQAASDANQVYGQGTGTNRPEVRTSVPTLVTGLTPGASGTITLQHKVTGGGTGTFNYRRIQIRYTN